MQQGVIVEKPPKPLRPDIENKEVIALLGNRGSGKTLYAVSLAKEYSEMGLNVYSNIELYGIKYVRTEFKDVSTFPEWLHDGILILDEMQVGADSYNFLGTSVQAITKFVTQIRKRNLAFIYITQDLSTVVKRLRGQTDYHYLFDPIENGITRIKMHDIKNNYKLVNDEIFDGRHLYDYYDTLQIIE